MTLSVPAAVEGKNLPRLIVGQASAIPRQPAAASDVSQALRRGEFESRLRSLMHLREMALRRWERYGNSSDRAQADAYQLEIDSMGRPS